MRPERIQLWNVMPLNRTVSEPALNIERKHLVAWNLDDVSGAPSQTPRSQKFGEGWISIHLLGREHIDFPHEAGVATQVEPFHPRVALVPISLLEIQAKL